MARPESMRSEPWTAFDYESYDFIDSGYPHIRFLTLKTAQLTDRSTIRMTSNITKGPQTMNSTEDFKFWFNLRGDKKLFMRFTGDYMKVHYDNGITVFNNNRRYNFYAGYQCHRNLLGGAFKVGACYISPQVRCDNRIKVDKCDTQFARPEVTYYHKNSYRINNQWRMQMFGVFNFTTQALMNNGFMVAYKNNSNQFFFRGEASQWRKDKFNISNISSYFRDFYFDYVYNVNPLTKMGVEVHMLSRHHQLKGITGGYERYFPEQKATLKVRFNSLMNLAVAVRRSMGSYGSYNIGIQLSDVGTKNDIKFGTDISINL